METQETDVAVTRDESMDLKSLMGTKEEKKEETSPLDSAIGSKQLGLVVNNKDLKKEEEPLRDYRDTDERRQEFSEKIDEMELKQKQAELNDIPIYLDYKDKIEELNNVLLTVKDKFDSFIEELII